MRIKRIFIGLMLFALLYPIQNYADTNSVTDWTSDILAKALTMSYQHNAAELETIRHNFTVNAWEALQSFLNTQTTHDEQTILTPAALGPAVVVQQGYYSGIQFWRINQTYNVPELDATIQFSVIVIKATDPPYMIQSLSMTKTQN